MGSVGDEVKKVSELNVKVGEPQVVVPAEPTEECSIFLSNIDQLVAYVVDTVYFYPPPPADKKEDSEAAVGKLRDVLGKVLVPYHFMAGRLRFNPHEMRMDIHCHRAGALFAEATCDLSISDLGDVSYPNPAFRSLNLHASTSVDKFSDGPLLMMQVTKFKCGGIAVGMSMNHALFDGIGAFEFMKNFSSMTRGEGMITVPLPDRTRLKARNPPEIKYEHLEGLKLSDIPKEMRSSFTTSKVADSDSEESFNNMSLPPGVNYELFPYSGEMVEKLKKKIMEEDGGKLTKCSSFDAIAALVWKARTFSAHLPDEFPSKMLFAVDIRSKMDPPLPKGFAGNAVFSAYCIEPAGAVKEKPLSFCVGKVQEAISRVTGDYVMSSMDFTETYKAVPAVPGGIFLSAWWKIPFFMIDFGFGKPMYAGPIVNGMVEFVLLLSNGKGDGGLNIYIALDDGERDKFAHNLYDLLA